MEWKAIERINKQIYNNIFNPWWEKYEHYYCLQVEHLKKENHFFLFRLFFGIKRGIEYHFINTSIVSELKGALCSFSDLEF